MKNSVIICRNLHKIYDDGPEPVTAVDGVNLTVGHGEFTALVGPSGSGKTTLLNIIGGLDDASSGTVEIAGEQITGMNESRRIQFRLNHIGFVFQSYNLVPVLTARENAEFVMMLQKRPRREIDLRVNQLLKEVGLEDQANRKPGELSGGQQQRVAVARALASKPKFVLADEPTANLDGASAANLLNVMARLNAQEGITFLFSTHDQRVIDRARRVITLEDGKIVSDISKV